MGIGGSYTGVKQPGREADHLPPSRMRGAISPLSQHVFMAWSSIKHRDKFTLRLSLKSDFVCQDAGYM